MSAAAGRSSGHIAGWMDAFVGEGSRGSCARCRAVRTSFSDMRIVRHHDYVASRKRRARIFSVVGFVTLSASLFVAWYPSMLLLAYVAMLAGFIMFNMGMQQLGKWTRNPRNDQLLDHRMKSLSDRITLVHYAQYGNPVIEHVAVHPGGVTVLTAREVDGTVEKRGARWRRKGGLFRRLFSFSGPQVGNPSYETEENIRRVSAYLEEQGISADVGGAVVFVHPNVELDIEDPDFPVLHGDEVDDFLMDQETDPDFTQEERERLLELLAAGEEFESARANTPGSRRPRPVKRVAAPKTRAKAQ